MHTLQLTPSQFALIGILLEEALDGFDFENPQTIPPEQNLYLSDLVALGGLFLSQLGFGDVGRSSTQSPVAVE